jgi:O-antigen/teichoic acid export membrane protein
VPSLLLLSLFGATTLGFYAIGAKIISLPTQFISASFSQVFYKKSVAIQ